jgi:NADH-quinone oxidoreductase subunit C
MLPETLTDQPLAQAIQTFDPGAMTAGQFAFGELTLEIDPARIIPVLRFLKLERQFNRLSSVTAVDWHPTEPRFEVVYHLHSIPDNQRVRLKCRLAGSASAIESSTQVFEGADWYEREIFDLFGITFLNHPDLRRIMLPDSWEGYPLRRDYPVHGHKYSYQNE